MTNLVWSDRDHYDAMINKDGGRNVSPVWLVSCRSTGTALGKNIQSVKFVHEYNPTHIERDWVSFSGKFSYKLCILFFALYLPLQ